MTRSVSRPQTKLNDQCQRSIAFSLRTCITPSQLRRVYWEVLKALTGVGSWGRFTGRLHLEAGGVGVHTRETRAHAGLIPMGGCVVCDRIIRQNQIHTPIAWILHNVHCCLLQWTDYKGVSHNLLPLSLPQWTPFLRFCHSGLSHSVSVRGTS